MSFLTTRILLVLALLMNGVMVAHAAVPLQVVADHAVVVMAEAPACHEAAADSESPEETGAMPCCQTGQCHCLVMQMAGVESSSLLPVLASPIALAASISYRSPVSPLMLRPPIA